MTDRTDRSGPTRTLLVFAVVLAGALAGGLAVGSWVGDTDDPPPTEAPVTTAHGEH